MIRRSVGSVDAWWQAIEAARILRGLSRCQLATAIQAAVPRRSSAARRAPSYAEIYHRGMSLPRAFAAMEALGCRLCDWRSLTSMLAGLEDRRRSRRRRSDATASPANAGSRTLLRDALASGEVWIEIEDVDDEAFEGAVARADEESAVRVVAAHPTSLGSVDDARVDELADRLARLEGRIEDTGRRRRPRLAHVDALEVRMAALEARVLAVEASIREGVQVPELNASDRLLERDRQVGDRSAAPVGAPPSASIVSIADECRGEGGNQSPGSADVARAAVDDVASTEVDCDQVEAVAGVGGDREPEPAEPVSEELDARLWAAFHDFIPTFDPESPAQATSPSRSSTAAKDDRDRRKKRQKDQRKQRKLARRR